MKTHSSRTLSLAPGEARRIGRGAGEVTVLHGRVWMTADGGGDDLVLSPGERLDVRDARTLVVEAWERGEGAVLRWRPRAAPQGLRLRTWLVGFVTGFLGALARRAASRASRAQGCISAGDSMASCGAVK